MFLQTLASTLRGTTTIRTRVQTTVPSNPVPMAYTLMAHAFALLTAIVRAIAHPKLGLKAFEYIVCITVEQYEHLESSK